MAGYLNDDEPKFLDMRKTRMFVGEEEVLTSYPDDALCQADRRMPGGACRCDLYP